MLCIVAKAPQLWTRRQTVQIRTMLAHLHNAWTTIKLCAELGVSQPPALQRKATQRSNMEYLVSVDIDLELKEI